MTGIPGPGGRSGAPNGPAPSEVEALLVATLTERADDVVWDPALADVTSPRAARSGARGSGGGRSRGGLAGVPGPRRVPAAVAWLSAAAAVVLVAVGASAMLRGGQDRGLPAGPVVTGLPATALPASEPASSVARSLPARFADAVATRPVRRTCADVPTSTDDPGTATVAAAPDLTFDPGYTDPALPPRGRPTSTVDVLPSGFPTGGQVPTPDAASDAVAYRLARAVDDRRFAELSLGPGVIVVHVVRGVDEAGAKTLVASCTSPSDGVTIQLVDRSEAQLRAVADEVGSASGIGPVGGAWIDTQRNRVLVAVERAPTRAERDRCAELYGGVVAYYLIGSGRVVEAVA